MANNLHFNQNDELHIFQLSKLATMDVRVLILFQSFWKSASVSAILPHQDTIGKRAWTQRITSIGSTPKHCGVLCKRKQPEPLSLWFSICAWPTTSKWIIQNSTHQDVIIFNMNFHSHYQSACTYLSVRRHFAVIALVPVDNIATVRQ